MYTLIIHAHKDAHIIKLHLSFFLLPEERYAALSVLYVLNVMGDIQIVCAGF